MTNLEVAYHEAGHAVVGYRLGLLDPDGYTVVNAHGGSSERRYHAPRIYDWSPGEPGVFPLSTRERRHIRNHLISTIAGPEAHRLHLGTDEARTRYRWKRPCRAVSTHPVWTFLFDYIEDSAQDSDCFKIFRGAWACHLTMQFQEDKPDATTLTATIEQGFPFFRLIDASEFFDSLPSPNIRFLNRVAQRASSILKTDWTLVERLAQTLVKHGNVSHYELALQLQGGSK